MYERVLGMNLHGLRLFHEIAKQKSVTKAAQKLNISQPAVTTQVKKFENDYNIKLLESAGRGIQLTELGQAIYQKSQELFSVERVIEQLIADELSDNKHYLKIGGNYLTMHSVLPQVLPTFKADYPQTKIQLTTLNTAGVIEGLICGTLDLGILGSGGANNPLLQTEQIYEDRLCFVVASTHPLVGQEVTLADLLESEFVGRETTSFLQQALLRLFSENQLSAPQFSVIYNNSHDALQAVSKQLGIHYCSYLVVEELITKGQLVELSVSIEKKAHPIYLCWKQETTMSVATKNFRKSVKEQLIK